MAQSKGNRKSNLSAETNQKRNTQGRREQMSSKNFAVPKGSGSKPGKDQYRLDDPAHARNALARVQQHGTPAEQRAVQRKVAQKYPSIGNSSGGGSAKSGASSKSSGGSKGSGSATASGKNSSAKPKRKR